MRFCRGVGHCLSEQSTAALFAPSLLNLDLPVFAAVVSSLGNGHDNILSFFTTRSSTGYNAPYLLYRDAVNGILGL